MAAARARAWWRRLEPLPRLRRRREDAVDRGVHAGLDPLDRKGRMAGRLARHAAGASNWCRRGSRALAPAWSRRRKRGWSTAGFSGNPKRAADAGSGAGQFRRRRRMAAVQRWTMPDAVGDFRTSGRGQCHDDERVPVARMRFAPSGLQDLNDIKREKSMERLKGKTAMVVGAGSIGPGWGNGKATAVTFAREGAQVFCVDRNGAAAQETVEHHHRRGRQGDRVHRRRLARRRGRGDGRGMPEDLWPHRRARQQCRHRRDGQTWSR